jgi:hypothetical protein
MLREVAGGWGFRTGWASANQGGVLARSNELNAQTKLNKMAPLHALWRRPAGWIGAHRVRATRGPMTGPGVIRRSLVIKGAGITVTLT